MADLYRKKPVVIEALRLNRENASEVAEWCGGEVFGELTAERRPISELDPCVVIETLEGEMTASLGDFVIKGIKGEFYPCKPDIFEMTYESVDRG